jgi:uncharacterized protein (TIGR02453 family)
MKNILDFLKSLQENNDRDWFNENRKQYESAKAEMEEVINQIIPLIKAFDPSIGAITAKECMFRIFRDVRFAKDKSPYKTNFGGFISKGGRKGIHSGYYLHIQPGASFIGGGCYMPQSDPLKKIRQEILYNIEEFKGIIKQKDFIKYFDQLEGDKLKRPPKDFPADFPDIELLKFKSYVVFKSVSDKEILSKNFMEHMIDIFKAMHPLNQFLNKALD